MNHQKWFTQIDYTVLDHKREVKMIVSQNQVEREIPDTSTHNAQSAQEKPAFQSRNPLEKSFKEELSHPRSFNEHVSQSDVEKYLANSNYEKVRSDYENGLLTLDGMVAHAKNSIIVSKQVAQLRQENPHLDEPQFQNLLGEKITDILLNLKSKNILDLSHYQPVNTKKNGYAKYLLYSQSHQKFPFCFQIFTFAPKQEMRASGLDTPLSSAEKKEVNELRGHRTRMHNHLAPCASSVLLGTMQETLYKPVEGTRKGDPLAQEFQKNIRDTGTVDGFDEEELNIVHALENIGPEKAVTMHFYKEIDGVDMETDKASGLRHISENLAGKANVAQFYRAVKADKPADIRN